MVNQASQSASPLASQSASQSEGRKTQPCVCARTGGQRAGREETKEEREGNRGRETQHRGGKTERWWVEEWWRSGGGGGNERESRDAERKMENIESGE